MGKKAKLTPKELKFCREWLKCGMNASEAARRAGYSPKTAYIIGFENLRKPKIKEEIARLRGNIEETVCISKEMVISEHIKVAFASIASLHNTWIERKDFEQLTDDQKSCIAEISTSIVKRNIGSAKEPDIVDVEYIKIKLFDKQKALDSISKILGYDAPTKVKVETEIEGFDVTIRRE